MRERMRACCEEVNKSACDTGERRDQGDGAREERDNTHRTLLEMRRGERETANTQPHSQLSPACEEGGMQKEAQHSEYMQCAVNTLQTRRALSQPLSYLHEETSATEAFTRHPPAPRERLGGPRAQAPTPGHHSAP